jgi:hypothetical protein
MKDALTTVIGLLSVAILTGMSYTEQFQQAGGIEAGGFDALAHDLFDSTQLASGDTAANAVRMKVTRRPCSCFFHW